MKSANERDDKTMEIFRKELVALFVDHFGKTSPNAMAVKTSKSVFPNDVNLEHDSEHQKFFRGMYNLCPSLTMHISHLTAATTAVHEDHGLKGKVLERKAQHDAKAAREALTKLHKTKCNWQRSTKPRMVAWQKAIFNDYEEQTDDRKEGCDEAPPVQKHMPKTTPASAGPQTMLKTTATVAGDKVKFFISSLDFKTTITVSCKPTSSVQDLVQACQKTKMCSRSVVCSKKLVLEMWSMHVLSLCPEAAICLSKQTLRMMIAFPLKRVELPLQFHGMMLPVVKLTKTKAQLAWLKLLASSLALVELLWQFPKMSHHTNFQGSPMMSLKRSSRKSCPNKNG